MGNLAKHLKIIGEHRKYVRKACFKMGILWQGLTHDLSKYSITELKICKYYSGTRSPHENCRDILGYSPSWNHHKFRNKHHWQFWIDDNENGEFIPIKMPYKYVIESFCDMVGAGKAYMKDKWDVTQPYKYYINKCKGKRLINKYSEYLLEKLLWNLHEAESEESFYRWYNQAKDLLEFSYEKDDMHY